MAASIQSQPPKPPAPPKTDTAAPKPAAEAKPAAQASSAPKASAAPDSKPAQAQDLFEQRSGGGRPTPTNGGSSFTPASAPTSNVRDVVSSATGQVTSALSQANANIDNALSNASATQGSAPQTPNLQTLNQISAAQQGGLAGPFDPGSFTGFPADQGLGQAGAQGLGSLGALGGPGGTNDFSNLFGGPAALGGPSPSGMVQNGGAAGGVSDRSGLAFDMTDLFSRNFGGGAGSGIDSGLMNPAMGGGGLGFLDGSGAGPGATSLPAPSIEPSITQPTLPQPSVSQQPFQQQPFQQQPSNSSGHHHHGGFHFGFNFGNAHAGGGGAAGGVADRW